MRKFAAIAVLLSIFSFGCVAQNYEAAVWKNYEEVQERHDVYVDGDENLSAGEKDLFKRQSKAVGIAITPAE